MSVLEHIEARKDGNCLPFRLNIAILVVGTQGDVQPFIAIGKILQSHGHRVRVATHEIYRDFVDSHDLEFYPLAGDPKELAAYMVETQGQLIPLRYDIIAHQVPKHMKTLHDIVLSTWQAVTAAEAGEIPFVADAILSNPVTYGHIHVAEKLGVPLHILFPQPWLPTKQFPHPLANISYGDKRRKRNEVSYKVVEAVMWQSLENMINTFRQEDLGLHKIRLGESGRKLLHTIPHSFLWSPLLLPKPSDWGTNVDVVGNVMLDTPIGEPPVAVESFLRKMQQIPVIFCGFGSMVMKSEKAIETTKMIIEASVQAKVALILQSSWTKLELDTELPETVLCIQSCPHSYLFQHVDAVIHHGGAGTTAAGLHAGKPTFIVPFFGDQHLWGNRVQATNVGPAPIPFAQLTRLSLIKAIQTLISKDIRDNAYRMGQALQAEIGAEAAVQAFYKHLPVKAMQCDVYSNKLATIWLAESKMKVCDAAAKLSPEEDHYRYIAVDHGARGPMSSFQGFRTGAASCFHECVGGVKDLVAKPVHGAQEDGMIGFGKGICTGVASFFIRPAKGVGIWCDRIATGHRNRHRKHGQTITPSLWWQKYHDHSRSSQKK